MHALGITPYFDGIFISSEHESKKPDVLFFDKLQGFRFYTKEIRDKA